LPLWPIGSYKQPRRSQRHHTKKNQERGGTHPGFKLDGLALVKDLHHRSDHRTDHADRAERNQQLAQDRTFRRAHVGAIRTDLVLTTIVVATVTGAGGVLNLDLVGLDLNGELLGGGRLQNSRDHALVINDLLAAEDRAHLVLTAGREAVLEASLPGSRVDRREIGRASCR